MPRFRKKPIVVEAHAWGQNGDHPEDRVGAIEEDPFCHTAYVRRQGAVVRYFRLPDFPGDGPCEVCGIPYHDHGWIDTLEGGHRVCPGDWIITGVNGERYPCKPDIFLKTYDPADDSDADEE